VRLAELLPICPAWLIETIPEVMVRPEKLLLLFEGINVPGEVEEPTICNAEPEMTPDTVKVLLATLMIFEPPKEIVGVKVVVARAFRLVLAFKVRFPVLPSFIASVPPETVVAASEFSAARVSIPLPAEVRVNPVPEIGLFKVRGNAPVLIVALPVSVIAAFEVSDAATLRVVLAARVRLGELLPKFESLFICRVPADTVVTPV